MSIKTSVRGSGSLRTLNSNTRDGAVQPHAAYMRLAALEMERQRREIESNAATNRVDRCAERCAEIDAEVADIRHRLDLVQASNPADLVNPKASRPVRIAATRPGVHTTAKPASNATGAVIQY